VGDQLQLVLAGEGRVVDLLAWEIEPDRRKTAGPQAEDAARPQLDVEAGSVGAGSVAQCGRVVLALRAAIVKEGAQVAFQPQRERRTIVKQALCARPAGRT
jgi:hypothetical protein